MLHFLFNEVIIIEISKQKYKYLKFKQMSF